MTADGFILLDGQLLSAVRLRVPARGPWHAECDFVSAPTIGKRCTLRVGSMTLHGTPVAGDAFGAQRRVHLVGGAGGWARSLSPRAYHNDAGLRARVVAEDLARETGEALGSFVPEQERIGVDYVRDAGLPASQILEDVTGRDVQWWVGFDGLTYVGQRPVAPTLTEEDYQVVSYDPVEREIVLGVSDPARIGIGSVITGPALPGPQVVREYAVSVERQRLRVTAWTGGLPTGPGRLAGLVAGIVGRVRDTDMLLGVYRYRVVAMAADGRVVLQAVRREVGLPDIEPISQWPGVAGAHAELAPGGEVLVQFIDGDRAQPIVTHYVGQGGPGFVPVSLTFCDSAQRAARQGDLVQSGGPGTQIVLIPMPPAPPTPTPIMPGTPYLVAFGVPSPTNPQPALYGSISTGSPKVKL